jgi:hypothetical protein
LSCVSISRHDTQAAAKATIAPHEHEADVDAVDAEPAGEAERLDAESGECADEFVAVNVGGRAVELDEQFNRQHRRQKRRQQRDGVHHDAKVPRHEREDDRGEQREGDDGG